MSPQSASEKATQAEHVACAKGRRGVGGYAGHNFVFVPWGAAEGTEVDRTRGFSKSSQCLMPEQGSSLLFFEGVLEADQGESWLENLSRGRKTVLTDHAHEKWKWVEMQVQGLGGVLSQRSPGPGPEPLGSSSSATYTRCCLLWVRLRK